MVSQSREKDIGDLVARGIVAKVLSRLLSEPDTETQVYIERVATPDLDGADELVSRRSRVHSAAVGPRRAGAELGAWGGPSYLEKVATFDAVAPASRVVGIGAWWLKAGPRRLQVTVNPELPAP